MIKPFGRSSLAPLSSIYLQGCILLSGTSENINRAGPIYATKKKQPISHMRWEPVTRNIFHVGDHIVGSWVDVRSQFHVLDIQMISRHIIKLLIPLWYENVDTRINRVIAYPCWWHRDENPVLPPVVSHLVGRCSVFSVHTKTSQWW